MNLLIKKYKLEDTIQLLPWTNHNETLGYLKRATMYLTTSLYEGLPIAVLEAMAVGKAIIASDVIGNNDCIKDGFNGYLLPQNNADLFCDKICGLIENEELLNEMGQNSILEFMSRFYIDYRIKELESIYLCK